MAAPDGLLQRYAARLLPPSPPRPKAPNQVGAAPEAHPPLGASAEGRPPFALPPVGSVAAQLVLADRLGAVGAVASSVAGAIQEPLGCTVANLGFVAEELTSLANELAQLEDDAASDRVLRAKAAVTAIADAVQVARGAVDRVSQLVRDVRAVARSDDAVGPLDVHRVLQSAIQIASPRLADRVRLDEEYCAVPQVDGNEARLGQVFLNVLTNAAQASADPSAAVLCVRVVTRTDTEGHCVIEISDTGGGIAPANLPRVFDPFFTTRPEAGAGLGLTSSRIVVASMGGTMGIESREGHGTLVWMTFPASGRGARHVAVRPTTPPAVRPRVLVIDDEPMMVRAIQRLLEGEYEVIASTDPADVLVQVEHGARYDVILCDLIMPDVSGMDLFDAIRRMAPEQEKRVMFMTGGSFAPWVQTFLQSVDNRRIEKPLERTALRAAIRALLNS